MPFNVESAEDLNAIEKRALTVALPESPKVLSVADILALDVPEAAMLIEGMIPAAGASLIVGAAKSGKTLAAVQMAIAVASGEALYGHYRVLLNPGPSLIVEQDDPAGAGSVKTILQRSNVDVTKIPFNFVGPVPYSFGVEFLLWLEAEIVRLGVRFNAFRLLHRPSWIQTEGRRYRQGRTKRPNADGRIGEAHSLRAVDYLHRQQQGKRWARLERKSGRNVRHVGGHRKPDVHL